MKQLIKRYDFYLLLGLVCMAFATLLVKFGIYKTFWMDDIAQMDMVLVDSLGEMLKACKTMDNNPPLSHLLSYIWIRIVPYGTFYLKLMNIFVVLGGVWFCGLAGKKIGGKMSGIISAVMAATTWQLVVSAAYTFRPYGCLFTFSAIALYYFCRINTEEYSLKNYVFYTVGLLGMIYSHYFGVMVMGMFFLFDMFFAWRRREKFVRRFLPHFIAGMVFLPWLLYILMSSLDKLTTFWAPVPIWNDLAQASQKLLSNRVWAIHLIYIAAIGILVSFYYKKEKTEMDFIKVSLVVIPVVILSVVFAFSVLFPNFGSLWVLRYFICLMPFLFCVCGIGFGYIFDLLADKYEWKVVTLSVCILFCVESFYNIYNQFLLYAHNVNEPYEQCAEWLLGQPDLCEETTLVFNTGYGMDNGWFYYLTRDGEFEEPNVVNYILNAEDLVGMEKVYLVMLHRDLQTETESVLAENGFVLVAQDGLPIREYVREISE